MAISEKIAIFAGVLWQESASMMVAGARGNKMT